MDYNEVVDFILAEGKTRGQFATMLGVLSAELSKCRDAVLRGHLLNVGIIPESFDHDSTEEKLYAKYSDAVIATVLSRLGLRAQLIEGRADSADVEAVAPDGHRLVADAKAFRLSRTAKNQKDFKVEALDQWRKGADYACLIGPHFQYPSTNSQIYAQAGRCNVTLLSYAHVMFLLDSRTGLRMTLANPGAWHEVWNAGRSAGGTKVAGRYWRTLNLAILRLSGRSGKELGAALSEASDAARKRTNVEIAFWQRERERLERLTHAAAVRELIASRKIDERIATIRNSIREVEDESG